MNQIILNLKESIFRFFDWWFNNTHWWRPRTCYVACDVCGHSLIYRREKIFYYTKEGECKSVCSHCEIPTNEALESRIYISTTIAERKQGRPTFIPVNDIAIEFERQRGYFK